MQQTPTAAARRRRRRRRKTTLHGARGWRGGRGAGAAGPKEPRGSRGGRCVSLAAALVSSCVALLPLLLLLLLSRGAWCVSMRLLCVVSAAATTRHVRGRVARSRSSGRMRRGHEGSKQHMDGERRRQWEVEASSSWPPRVNIQHGCTVWSKKLVDRFRFREILLHFGCAHALGAWAGRRTATLVACYCIAPAAAVAVRVPLRSSCISPPPPAPPPNASSRSCSSSRSSSPKSSGRLCAWKLVMPERMDRPVGA